MNVAESITIGEKDQEAYTAGVALLKGLAVNDNKAIQEFNVAREKIKSRCPFSEPIRDVPKGTRNADVRRRKKAFPRRKPYKPELFAIVQELGNAVHAALLEDGKFDRIKNAAYNECSIKYDDCSPLIAASNALKIFNPMLEDVFVAYLQDICKSNDSNGKEQNHLAGYHYRLNQLISHSQAGPSISIAFDVESQFVAGMRNAASTVILDILMIPALFKEQFDRYPTMPELDELIRNMLIFQQRKSRLHFITLDRFVTQSSDGNDNTQIPLPDAHVIGREENDKLGLTFRPNIVKSVKRGLTLQAPQLGCPMRANIKYITDMIWQGMRAAFEGVSEDITRWNNYAEEYYEIIEGVKNHS